MYGADLERLFKSAENAEEALKATQGTLANYLQDPQAFADSVR